MDFYSLVPQLILALITYGVLQARDELFFGEWRNGVVSIRLVLTVILSPKVAYRTIAKYPVNLS